MRVFKKHNVERRTDSEAKAQKLLNAGYEELVVGEADKKDETKELAKMKLEELRTLAVGQGIEGTDSLTKKELLALLKDAM